MTHPGSNPAGTSPSDPGAPCVTCMHVPGAADADLDLNALTCPAPEDRRAVR